MPRKSPQPNEKNLEEQIVMLRTQGFTLRQICSTLNIKSTDTVSSKIKNSLEQKSEEGEMSLKSYKSLEMNRCDERFGRLAEWRNMIEKMDIPPERRFALMLTLEDREMKNQERLIKLLNLEQKKEIMGDTLDFHKLRERAAEVEKKDRELKENPALSGRVR